MANPIIERAQARRAAAAQRLEEAKAQLSQVEAEIKGWDEFIAKAASLTNDKIKMPEPAPALKPTTMPSSNGSVVKVRKDSLAAYAAALLKDKGPLTIKEIADYLRDYAKGTTNFAVVVNSAIWRRRDDLFEKKGKLVYLRTENVNVEE